MPDTLTVERAPSAADPFAHGGIIVNEDAKALLALLDREPRLGPLARELFEVEEEQGNVPGGALREPERSAELDARFHAVFDPACECPAETIGGVAWRLGQIRSAIAENDETGWVATMVRTAFADAVRLAEAERDTPDPVAAEGRKSISVLYREWHDLEDKIEALDGDNDAHTAPLHEYCDRQIEIRDEIAGQVATDKAGLIAQVYLLSDYGTACTAGSFAAAMVRSIVAGIKKL